ncbi:MAG TPA: TetR family transcriptional regulator [Solirubrobacteraceae bacterium]
MSQELGLRERKKQRTRQLIADTARALFAERGFDAVPVAEVARAAEVSEATVFNYFPTKEDLFFSGLEVFEQNLLSAIREREPGESVLDAFARFVLQPRGLLAAGADDGGVQRLVAITRVITESPALLAREQRIFAGYTDSLAALIAKETRARAGAIEPWVAANALMGVHRALIDYARRQIVAGARNPQLARNVRAQGKHALGRLEAGLGDYAVKDG